MTIIDTKPRPVILCFSHLRWDFVWQRPQQLLSRALATFDVVYVEEPVREPRDAAELIFSTPLDGLTVVQPHVPAQLDDKASAKAADAAVRALLRRLSPTVVWFYTPMALPLADGLEAPFYVYDCMDDLASFKGASPQMREREDALMRRADLVLTGGPSLFESRRSRHRNVHLFPSSVDTLHFRKGRCAVAEPADQARLATPRIGFFGVIDERMDFDLVRGLAALRPQWQLVFLGPTVKVDPGTRPQAANIHWLGMKAYDELPLYLAGWSAGIMSFALNEATRHISPTKTPEFLAAGLPVVCTAITDVVRLYVNLVDIACDAEGFAACLDRMMRGPRPAWLEAVDEKLQSQSWDRTWQRIEALLPSGRRARSGIARSAVHV